MYFRPILPCLLCGAADSSSVLCIYLHDIQSLDIYDNVHLQGVRGDGWSGKGTKQCLVHEALVPSVIMKRGLDLECLLCVDMLELIILAS